MLFRNEGGLAGPLKNTQAFLLNESNAPQQTDAAAHMVRSDLNKNLRS